MILKYGTPVFPQNCDIEQIEMITLDGPEADAAYAQACEEFDIAFQAELAKDEAAHRSHINLSDLVFTE